MSAVVRTTNQPMFLVAQKERRIRAMPKSIGWIRTQGRSGHYLVTGTGTMPWMHAARSLSRDPQSQGVGADLLTNGRYRAIASSKKPTKMVQPVAGTIFEIVGRTSLEELN